MSQAPPTNTERLTYWLAVLAVFAYVAKRAATMPWVHDECASLFWYVERGEWLPGIAHWDANNHVLSTLVGLLSYKIIGLSLLGSRIGSVLSFVVWAFSAWRIGQRVNDAFVRASLRAALLFCPFLLDFFSLFRGYGLEMAFWLLAIDGALRYIRSRALGDLVQLLVAMLLANAAVLALVPLWAIIVLAAFVVALRGGSMVNRSKQLVVVVLCGMLPLLGAAWLSFELKDRGLLYHGTLDGFAQVSIASLNRYVLGSDSMVLAWGLLALVAAATLVGLVKRHGLLLMCAGLFWADAVARMGMARLLGVNYPEDRAALHLLLLAIISIACMAEALSAHARSWRWLAALLLLLPLRSALFTSNDRTLLWPEQHISKATAQALARPGNWPKGRPVILGAYHQTFLSVPYAMRVNGLEAVVPVSEGFPGGLQDLRLVDDRFAERAMPGYRQWDSWYEYPRMLERNEPILLQQVDERVVDIADEAAEFIELLHPDTLQAHTDYAIELDAELVSQAYLDLHLVVELGEEDGLAAYRDDVPFALFRPVWTGERLRFFRTFTTRAASTRQVVYLWNPPHDNLPRLEGALRLYRVISIR